MATDHDWTAPAFLDEANRWIRSQVEVAGLQLTGDIVQQHVQPWSTVLRVPTDAGALYFKANEDAMRHEAAVASYLAQRRPGIVPPPVAVDTERGWLLMRDAGSRLREVVEAERSVERWRDVLADYASLQLDLAGSNDDLIRLGVADLRLDRLPQRFADLLEQIDGLPEVPADLLDRASERASTLGELCERLAAYDVPETIQHDDLNDGQIYVGTSGYLILDWGDACISHPFFSLSVALEGVISWGVDDVENSVDTAPYRDAYLAPFAMRLGKSMDDLRAAAQLAVRLGWACRSANGHVATENATPTVRRLQMFLDGHL